MKTIFDTQDREELITRINQLKEDDSALWGKMNSYQMTRHMILDAEMLQGKTSYKRLFIGKLFGKSTLKKLLANAKPIRPNQPTHAALKITEMGELSPSLDRWKELLHEFGTEEGARFNHFVHPFFGPMSSQQIGKYAFKHIDHHLRQFNR